ncbi:MAG: SCO family protein [Pseudomonadota bacterium]
MPSRLVTYSAGGVAVAALAGVGVFFALQERESAAAMCNAGTVAGDMGGPFELVSETGETVTSADVITEPALIYFGYTFCPDVCPLDTVRNAEAVEILSERGMSVKPIFVSIDPARDTPEVVDDFTANLHPDMLGLTGSDEQVRAASQAYRTYFKRHDDDDDEYYLVDHTTFNYLVMPGDEMVGFFRRELSGGQLADQVQCVLENTS